MRIDIANFIIKSENKTLIDGVNLSIESGKITALIGASGSGKTILSTAIIGFLARNLKFSGEVLLDNQKVNPKWLFSNIMQNPRSAFNPLFSIKNSIIETMKARKTYGKDSDKEIERVLKSVLLDCSTLDLYPHQLSGGMLQRVMIAISILSKTKFLIADEPTSDLDLISQKGVLEILENLKNSGIGILLITHDFSVVARLADYIYVLNSGKIVEHAKSKEIFYHPKNEITKSMLKAHLSLYGEKLC